ncbi:hypothetical protein [Gilvimarinus sp. 1_MG-2023]|nr:hypothetical protein [Gilvimarinus sp. 1_MG-2023]MDO6747359.1 hypothetical protein [Gilvimarinus sp. 1_MG-2023]
MTHILRLDQSPASILGSARLIGQPVAREVTDSIIQWVQAQSG